MTALLQLVYTADLQADQDTLNLLDYQFGFQLSENGWTPKVAVGNAENVIETITLRIGGASQDIIAARIQVLEDWIMRVYWAATQPNREFQVWLRVKDTSETNPRQAQILEMSAISLDTRPAFDYDQRDSSGLFKIQTYVLTIRRSAFWEPIDETPLPSAALSIDSMGGYKVLSPSIYGDVPARVCRVFILTSGAGTQTKVWIGFRTSNWGILANFKPVWDLSLAGTLDADTTVVADAGAYNGATSLQCTFATNTFKERVRISVGDVTADYADQRGDFVVLLRMRSSDASTFKVRISSGFENGTGFRVLQSLIVSGTSYQLFEMGALGIPPSELPNSINSSCAIRIEAVRLTGGGNLHFDCLQFIPYTDGFAKVLNGIITLATDEYVVIIDRIKDVVAANVKAGAPSDIINLTTARWSMPANNEAPYIVLAAQRATSQVLTDEIDFVAYVKTRWRTMRGNE